MYTEAESMNDAKANTIDGRLVIQQVLHIYQLFQRWKATRCGP